MTGIESELSPSGALEALRSGEVAPWRQFRWHRGQAHYSGLYWSATTGGHVAYESRLELARMLLADFAPDVCWIVAQPFLVEALVAGQARRHVPDIALIDCSGGITIVNVKPPDRIGDPKVAATFAWARRVFGTRGWQHEVWTGAPEVLLGNVRFLAGYRRSDRFDAQLLEAVMAMADEGNTIGDLDRRCRRIRPAEVVRPALLHLLWSSRLRTDLSTVLSDHCALERAA
ncbi:MAG TPA: TnsA-like heteromeric transposase endonuclease subunit [Acidimicrobiales bacterium]|nr:TnsA-like heteromeric transposase endonuclease subunit [Acidimicrobiales bacterium]